MGPVGNSGAGDAASKEPKNYTSRLVKVDLGCGRTMDAVVFDFDDVNALAQKVLIKKEAVESPQKIQNNFK